MNHIDWQLFAEMIRIMVRAEGLTLAEKKEILASELELEDSWDDFCELLSWWEEP